jgi:hypothetical protein
VIERPNPPVGTQIVLTVHWEWCRTRLFRAQEDAGSRRESPTRGDHLGVRGILDLASAARKLDAMPKVVRRRREAAVGAAFPLGVWMLAMRAAQRNSPAREARQPDTDEVDGLGLESS